MISETAQPFDVGMFSADSHVIESPEVWKGILAPSFWPDNGQSFHVSSGGTDPERRAEEMAIDGVVAEVLYPSLGLKIFGVDDPGVQEAACRAYNQWLIDYCAADPTRLLGVGMIPAFDAERGVEEVRFCSDGGFRGVMLWQSPHPDLPFAGDHYDSIWREAEVRGLPVSLHILSGFSSREVLARGPLTSQGPSFFRGAINLKLLAAMDAVNDLIMSGVLHRFPGLRIVIVENEVGWLPFALTQLDYYYHRFHDTLDVTISQPPSVYAEQIYATFFRDAMTPHLFSWWGGETCMWSNDFPHGNSTWPNSRHLVERNLGGLPHDTVAKLLRGNAERLYGALPDTADDILKETAH